MSKKLLFALTFLTSLSAIGQTQIQMPISPQSGTFTGNVRGYYFTAPTCFTITGLMVPTDASTGAQSIAVVRFWNNLTPPLYSTTTNAFTVLYLTQSNSTAGIIPVNIQVEQGDVIGILGQRATVCSYGAGNYATNIDGYPVTISRLGMQFPLTTTAPQQLWTEAAGSISRVNMYYDTVINYTASHTVLNQSDVSFSSNADTSFTTTWDYGDGSPLDIADNPTHTYAIGGTYTVCAYITNSCGTDTVCQSVTVCGSAVTTAAYTASTMGAMAMFSDASTNANSWYWDFGDSNTSTLQSPSHTYAASGTYTVCLIASNGSCDSDTICTQVTVCIAPTVTFGSSAMGGGTYAFAETSTDATSWTWDFGDGSPLGSGSTPSHTYALSGTYTVCVTAYGCDSVTTCDTVNICVDAAAAYSMVDSSGTVNFFDASTNATTWMWDFGDATTSTLQNPTHTYSANGTYTVCLIAAGCTSDTICTSVTVCPEVPGAVFTSSDSAMTAMFNGPTSGVTAYLWDFGDGNFSTVQNPTHVYGNTGVFNVCLTVYNLCGDSATSCDTVTVIMLGDVSLSSVASVGIYPNPANDAATVTVTSAEYTGNYVFEMYDAAGKLVRVENGVFGQQLKIERNDISSGIYLYKIRKDDAVIGNGKLMFAE